ncbi:MAG TPA: CHAT domain-containing protein [Thermoanaerobaculia bacterium]|nr:CHAT domain-containing protein [Thermoanaerobaculia bacterium]
MRATGLVKRTAEQGLLLEADLVGQARLRRGAAPEPILDFEVDAKPGERFVALVRHPSGALTISMGEPIERRSPGRRAGSAVQTLRFTIEVGSGEPAANGRRSWAGKVVRVLVWKVIDRGVERGLEKLARRWEAKHWKEKQRNPGWVRVTPAGLRQERLEAVAEWGGIGERNLLLLHGTFSSAEGAFRGLAETQGSDGRDFFTAMREIYGDRVFAFNHFSVSESPVENARALLEALPNGPIRFDVITHSRGGLVLRHLVERQGDFDGLASRFALGHAVLVAAPNEGTPLASPKRWQDTVGWFANFVDMFPDNGLTFGLEFVSEGLVWIARRAVGSLPGLAAMNPLGDFVAALQGATRPANSYSALVANFEPDARWARLLDAGVDGFFGCANDLVVPSEGGWRVDHPPAIGGERIGCFGPGGNLQALESIYHTNFFRQPATVDFLVRALSGAQQPVQALDPATLLPFRGRFRAAGQQLVAARPVPAVPVEREPEPAAAEPPALPPLPRAMLSTLERNADALHLFILDPRTEDQKAADEHAKKRLGVAKILASYRNARVLADFPLRNQGAGQRFQRIIAQQRSIRAYIDGEPTSQGLPNDGELRYFGRQLFECLFPGEVRSLYDGARTTHDGRRLDIILTSMIHWVADLPWEFAFDPTRGAFLATEEINFVRNVVTAIPAEEIPPRSGALRILVVAAQPVGWGQLSIDEEIELVSRGFRPLQEMGLVEFEVLRSASPESFHKRLQLAQIEDERFDVLHFIGHGEYLESEKVGCVVFEDGQGGASRLEADQLRQIACRRGIRILFLNACETGSGGHSDFNRGVAQGLVAGGLPIVVGNQYKVLDSSATAFAQYFYWALARGATVGDASREARVAVNYSIHGEAIDWAVPVVFAQNPHEVLCRPSARDLAPERTLHSELTASSNGRRRAGRVPAVRIGLWDVNSALPHLARLVEHLNQVQSHFSFEAVEITAPIGTWRLVRDKKRTAQGYVYAEQVVSKLRNKPAELGLTKLFCFTTFPLGDQDFKDLYFWDDDKLDQIAVFSFAGFEEDFAKPGLSVERAVVNQVSGSLIKMQVHYDGVKSCPCYFNGERDALYVAGPLAFCPTCEQYLTRMTRQGKVSPEAVAAAKAVLKAYPLEGFDPAVVPMTWATAARRSRNPRQPTK